MSNVTQLAFVLKARHLAMAVAKMSQSLPFVSCQMGTNCSLADLPPSKSIVWSSTSWHLDIGCQRFTWLWFVTANNQTSIINIGDQVKSLHFFSFHFFIMQCWCKKERQHFTSVTISLVLLFELFMNVSVDKITHFMSLYESLWNTVLKKVKSLVPNLQAKQTCLFLMKKRTLLVDQLLL